MVSIGFLLGLEFSGVVWGVGRCPVGFVAPWTFKTLDSQPGKCHMSPVSIDFHDFRLFRQRCQGFLAWYLSCFRPGRRKVHSSSFSVETEKMRDEKLCRFVVVSPREVHLSPGLCHFKFSDFQSFLKVLPFVLFQSSPESVH